MTEELPVVRLTSPGEIVAAVPHLCGFVPAESLVAVSLRGERRRIGLTLRLDLPPDDGGADADIAEQVAARLAYDGAATVVLVVFTAADGELPREALVGAVTEAAERRGMTVMEALLVRGERWSSYTCRHPDCCPVGGTPIPGAAAELVAAAAYDGRVVLRDREALVASLAPPLLVGARAAEQRLDAAMVRWFADVAVRGREVAGREAVRAVREVLRLPDGAPGEDALPALVVSLQDVLVRDEVAVLALDDSEGLLALLLRMSRETVAPYDVPVCTLLAVVAWLRGDGALANVALDRALDGDPAYSMARLVRAGLDGQLPPTAVRRWLRETRRTMQPRRRRRAA
ncbi:MAG: uncharacterized protein JWP11_2477 [Frankiales bacterium]|nr:uncharacterized protein [Frankiales bacterium]